MICPRCGWVMHLLNTRDHNEYEDQLYQCQCGTTHLQIKPKVDKVPLQPDWFVQPEEEHV